MRNRVVILSVLLVLLLSSCNLSLAEDITPPPGYIAPTVGPTLGVTYPSLPPSPARGQVIFTEHCEACHGIGGLGNGPQSAGVPVPVSAIGLRDIASQYNPSKWYKVISQGQVDRFMPPFTSLTDDEKWDVLSYVFTLSNPPELVEQGSEVYSSKCATCHGTNGDASRGSMAGSVVDFSDQVFMSQVTGLGLYQAISDGVEPEMQAFKETLSENEIWALTAYLRTLTYDMNPLVLNPTLTPTITNEPQPSPSPSQADATADPESTITVDQTSTTEPTPESVDAQLGRVFGKLINASGGSLPDNQLVVLHGYVDMQEALILETEIDSNGSFEFNDVPLEPGIALLVTVETGDITYNSDFSVFEGSITDFELPLTIYDTTSDNSTISADRVHIFFDFVDPGSVQVIEIYIISNTGNLAIVSEGSDGIVQEYALPGDASNLLFETGSIGDPYITTENGFGDPSTILPGSSTHQMMYAFELPYDKKLTFEQPLTMSVGQIIVMAPDGIDLSSDQLTSSGSRDMQGQTYLTYSGGNFSSSDTITLQISGKANGSAPVSDPDQSRDNLIIGLGVFGVALILAAFFFYFRSRSDHNDYGVEFEDEDPDTLGDDPDAIMDAINSLDDQFKDGLIKEEAYQIRRETLKSRLKELL